MSMPLEAGDRRAVGGNHLPGIKLAAGQAVGRAQRLGGGGESHHGETGESEGSRRRAADRPRLVLRRGFPRRPGADLPQADELADRRVVPRSHRLLSPLHQELGKPILCDTFAATRQLLTVTLPIHGERAHGRNGA